MQRRTVSPASVEMIRIRVADIRDVPFIAELERTSSTAAHWSEEQYRNAIDGIGDRPERVVLVAEAGKSLVPRADARIPTSAELGLEIAAFLIAWHVIDEWQLENIVVAPHLRGKGLGMQLIAALMKRVRKANGGAVFLEVRESNATARKLYEKAGFRQTGQRKLYYANPVEDAVLYSLRL